ncbi:hypothetical protein ANACOL_00334 [Anaerotruncus colihominis DSM 17241]|uniref:Uncharacterized protein n=1 Tax=Anaerotruncus colihominis DSM 17241 TaxID=445972 RepID=B0P6F8_9FIRM|nr:hypothetical protein ANACOL_00334 [Anaerotruncus colihominis DSM 17241]
MVFTVFIIIWSKARYYQIFFPVSLNIFTSKPDCTNFPNNIYAKCQLNRKNNTRQKSFASANLCAAHGTSGAVSKIEISIFSVNSSGCRVKKLRIRRDACFCLAFSCCLRTILQFLYY